MGKIIAIFFLLSTPAAFGQSNKLNSLLNELKYAHDDTSKVRLLLDIERKYFAIDLDSALYYNKLCEKLILKINALDYKHRCFHDFVKIYHAKRDYASALDYCLQSIDVAKLNKDKFQEATSYRAIFNIYHNLNRNDSAVKYAVHSIHLTTEIGDTSNIATNYGNLSWLYMDLNQYDKAIQYGLKGIEAGEHYVDTVGLLISINNTALCYLRMNDNHKAIELFNKQYVIGKRINRARSVRNALINLGAAYYNLGDATGLERSSALLNEYNSTTSLDNQNKCLQSINSAYNSILHKKFKLAEEHLLTAMKIAEADSLIQQLLTCYITLSHVKFAQLDFAAGNDFEQKWDSLTESQDAIQLAEYAAELEAKYETEKKSEKIVQQENQLRQKSLINYLLAGAGVGLLIIFLLTYRTYTQKQKLQQQRIRELETEKQLTAIEAVLQGEEQERTRLAQDLHDGLGGMLSGIKYSFNTMKENLIMTPENQQAFARSMDMLDSSIKEMRTVAHNLMPEALVKFGLDTALKDYCHDIQKSGALQVQYQSIGLEGATLAQTTAITVYRIVQELITNTLKHASAKTAIVQITKSDKLISVTVEDDGKGFDTALLKLSKGIGWTNIQHRTDFLKGKLDVNSGYGKGTSVHIEFHV
jgi:two-component system, NarL family, sensor kinase